MKRVLLILEGAGDDAGDGLPGTDGALHAARTPALDDLARAARLGTAQMIPEGCAPGAEVSLAATLGIDPLRSPIGRGPAEALAWGIELGRDDTALRASLVQVVSGALQDCAPEPLRLAEVRGVLHAINQDAPAGAEVVPGEGHRCVLVLRGSPAGRTVRTFDPHAAIGRSFRENLPYGRGSRLLSRWMLQSLERLENHELNTIRADLGEPEVTAVWFWGGGAIPRIPTFRERFGLGGELVSPSALLRGIGRVARLEIADLGARQRDRRAELALSAEKACAALQRRDFVCVHTDWPDSAGHRGVAAEKVAAIEACDELLVGPIASRLAAEPEWRMLVTTAHATPAATRQHSAAAAQVLLAGSEIASNRGDRFDEGGCAGGEIRLAHGAELAEYFLTRT